MTVVRVMIAAASVALIGFGGLTAWRSRALRFPGLALLGLGVALALGVCDPGLLKSTSPASVLLRIRLVMGFLSFLVLMITLESVRRFAMEERYALLWVSTGLILLVFAVYPDAVGWIAAITGMQYVTAINVVVFAFLLLVTFHLSLALSKSRDSEKRICQYVASLELRLASLERQLAAQHDEAKPAADKKQA